MERGGRRRRVEHGMQAGMVDAGSGSTAVIESPAAKRREWRERSMDRVFDEYMKFLKDVPEQAAGGTKRKGARPDAKSAYRKYRAATRKRRQGEDEDEE